MLNRITNKIKNKKGSVDLVTILIAIVIFAAVAYFSLTAIGTSIGNGAKTTQSSIDNMLK